MVEPVRGARLVLLDDVITTGATMNAAAHALKEAGAERVDGLAFARGVWGIGARGQTQREGDYASHHGAAGDFTRARARAAGARGRPLHRMATAPTSVLPATACKLRYNAPQFLPGCGCGARGRPFCASLVQDRRGQRDPRKPMRARKGDHGAS